MIIVQGATGIEWDVKEWKKEIEKRMKLCGSRDWKQGMERRGQPEIVQEERDAKV
jgi:hypothetical protein